MYKSILLQKSKISDAVRITFLTLCLYFAAGNTQAGWLYYVVAMIFGLLVMNLIISACMLSGTVISRALPQRPIRVGENFTVELTVKNTSRLALYHSSLELSVNSAFAAAGPLPEHGGQDEMLVKDFNGSTEAFMQPDSAGKILKFYLPCLPPQQEIRIACCLKALRRGIFAAGTVKQSASYPFSLINVSRRHFKNEDQPLQNGSSEISQPYIRVYPAPIKIPAQNRRQSSYSNQKILALKSSEGTLRGLHEYSEGEDVRHIHWMTSARLNKTVIKEFQQNTERDNLLFIPIADYSVLSLLDSDLLSKAIALKEQLGRPNELSSRLRSKMLEKLDKAKEELNGRFGFEELLCCLITASENCSGSRGGFSVVLPGADKLQSINSIERLRNEIPGWSVLDNPFCLKNDEQKSAFYNLLHKMLLKSRFSRIIVLSLSQEALPVPCPAAYKKKIEYLLFSPLAPSEQDKGISEAFSAKIAALKSVSRSAELITPNTPPERAAGHL
ncbi:DUF58 domain-containing protein [bacterium]|nr:DUF58 domain-containing protein [bacterium]